MKRIIFLVFLASAAAVTQSSGALLGLITEPGGEAVRSAHITLVDLTRGVRRETTTNAEGIYAFSLLPPGTYRVEAVKTGFAAFRAQPIVLNINEKRSLRLQLVPKTYSFERLLWHRPRPTAVIRTI